MKIPKLFFRNKKKQPDTLAPRADHKIRFEKPLSNPTTNQIRQRTKTAALKQKTNIYTQKTKINTNVQKKRIKTIFRKFFGILRYLFPLLFLFAIYYFLANSNTLLIKSVSIYNIEGESIDLATSRIEKYQYESNNFVGLNFFSINLDPYQEMGNSDPFIRQLLIKKVFPDKLEIYIEQANPDYVFLTPNELVLIDENGSILERQDASSQITISEIERIIYYTQDVFKCDLLQQKWETTNSEKIAEQYNSAKAKWEIDIEAQKSNEQSTSNENTNTATSIETSVNGNLEGDDTSPILIPDVFPSLKEYTLQQFSSLANADLTEEYKILRSEVKLTIDNGFSNWQEKMISYQGIPVIESLVSPEEYLGFNIAFTEGRLGELLELLRSQGIVQNPRIISPQIISVQYKSELFPTKTIDIQLNLDNNIQEDVNNLQTLLVHLQTKKINFSRIDLSGEKLVVS